MDEVAIVTDSAACLPRDLIERYKIHIVPAGNVLFRGRIFRDGHELTHEAAYHILEREPDKFFTSPVSPNELLETFVDAGKNAGKVLYISLSSKLSTLYNAAQLAKQMAANTTNHISIEIMDSETVTAAQGFIVLAAARTAAKGKLLPEVISAAGAVKSAVDLCYIIENIHNLYRSGRLPKAIADVGSKLNAMPIVTVRNNSIHLCHIVRNKKSGISNIIEILKRKVGDSPIRAAVLHSDAFNEASEIYNHIYENFDCFELWINQFSPLMAYTTGRGVIGIAFYADDTFEG